ncbi:MAG: outer membrane beta-barrel protein [Prolixibacteraceae bacterium]|nr:outer membrane beta-barrel protein [Prolixibacteraceae bacterium]
MKPEFSFSFIAFLLISSFVSGQDFNVGIENGINFSNIKSSEENSRFPAQSGPINGVYIKYNIGDWMTLQSGANHVSFYFKERSYYYPYYLDDAFYRASLFPDAEIIAPYYNSYQNKLSFLRIPLLLKLHTPGRLNFEIGGGAYYAFLTNDEYRGKDQDFYTKEYRDEHFPPMNDWGWILASSVNYSVNAKLSLFINGQITTGNKVYFENIRGKTGSTEITFGVGYKPFAKETNFGRNDSLGQYVKIIPQAGITISRIGSNKNSEKYGTKVGFSSGVNLKFLISKNFALYSGAWYERKGYSLDYTGYRSFIYRPYLTSGSLSIPRIYSDIHFDYITFPAGLEVTMGEKIRSNISIGAYFSLLQNAFAEGERLSTYSYDNKYQVSREFFNESLNYWFKKTDIGLLLGYRLEFDTFDWGDVFVAAYQSIGMKNLFYDLNIRNPGEFFNFNEKMRNNSTTISIGLSIPVSKN